MTSSCAYDARRRLAPRLAPRGRGRRGALNIRQHLTEKLGGSLRARLGGRLGRLEGSNSHVVHGSRQEGGRESPPLHGLRPGAFSRDEQVFEFRHIVFDHLHPFRGHQLLRPGDLIGRRRGSGHRLDRRLRRFRGVRRRHGADRLGLPDCGRALSLGVDSRQPLHRLGHGMAQPARPHHGDGRHQYRHRRSSSPARSVR